MKPRLARFTTDLFPMRALSLGLGLVLAMSCARQPAHDLRAPPAGPGRPPRAPTVSMPLPYTEGWESGGLDGWTATTTSGVCTWHVQNHPETNFVAPDLNPFAITLADNGGHLPAAGGTNVVWFGNDSTGTYIGSDHPAETSKNGGTSAEVQSGSLYSPSISLAGVAKATLEFDSWWEIEGVAGQAFDVMLVFVSQNGGAYTQIGELNPTFATAQPSYAAYSSGGTAAPPVWRHYQYDISSYVGSNVQFQFNFSTRDNVYNAFRGWTIDNVVVSGGNTLPAPTISSVSPNSGVAGDLVTINGANFVQGAIFKLGTTQLTITQFGANAVVFKVPSLASGAYDATVTNPDGQTFTLTSGFFYSAAPSPSVSSISPSSAQIGTATNVTINGANFVSGATVAIGTAAATNVVFVSAAQLTATVPGLGAGTYNVTVTNPSGQTGSKLSGYTVADNSTIAVTSPNGGESWNAGSTQNVTWTSSGANTVSIDLYKGGAFAANIAASIPGSTGSFSWAIPFGTAPGSDYKVKIFNPQGTTTSQSAGFFTVAPGSVATSTSVSSSAGSSVYGQAVSFTATISPSAATGTVQFQIDGSNFGGPATVSGGSATSAAATFLSPGPHAIAAIFTGSGVYTASSGSFTQSVSVDATSASLSSSPASPMTFGQAVAFAVTIAANAPGSGTPTGTVTLFDNGASLGSAALSGGSASFNFSSFATGTHAMTVSYSGDSNYSASSSGTLSVVVNRAATSVALASSAPTQSFGAQVVLTATVAATAPGSGTPDGSVVFTDGGVTLGTAALSGGVATLSTSSLAVGAHSVTASYGGSGSYLSSASSALSQTITKANPSVALAFAPAAPVWGQPVTLTATATGPGATPSGTITFLDGSTAIGTGTLSGGVATLTLATLAVGSHSMTASYGGDGNFNGAVSSASAVAVAKASSAGAVASSAPTTTFGAAVTFTATISAVSPGAGTPTGTVTFFDGSSSLGAGTLSGGATTLSTSSLSVGAHSITASYSGDGNFLISTSPVFTETILKADPAVAETVVIVTVPTTQLPPPPPPTASNYGGQVTLTATITGPGAIPTGTVQFFYEGTNLIGSAPVDANGVATLTVTTIPVGKHSITAAYSGDGNFNAAVSAGQPLEVVKSPSTVSLSVDLNPVLTGEGFTMSADVAASGIGKGTPTGTVTFFDGATALGTVTLGTVTHQPPPPNACTPATVTTDCAPNIACVNGFCANPKVDPTVDGFGSLTVGLGVGSHSLTAVYPGDNNFASFTTPALTETVLQATTSLNLVTSKATTVFGEPNTFTATISVAAPGAGVPTGTVTFVQGTNTLGTAQLDPSGVATLTSSGLDAGPDTVTATYAGTPGYKGSQASVSVGVSKASTSTLLTAAPNPSSFNQAVSLTATISVVAPGAGAPSGNVSFFDGTTLLGTGTISGGAASIAVSTLAVGSHPLTAVYLADSSFAASTSAVVALVVNKAVGTATLSTSPAAPVFGQPVLLSANVTGPGSTPTGSVSFSDGATLLGSSQLISGVATLTVSSLAVGSHAITCAYLGDATFAGSTSSPSVVAVGQAASAISLASSQANANFGSSITISANLSAVSPGSGVPSGTVTFFDGATSLGTATASNGVATLATSALTVGSHTLTATYGGDASFTGSSSGALVETIGKAAPTVAVGSAPAAPVFGQPVTLTATLTGPGATPSGSVTFLDGSTTLGTAAVANGVATFTLSTLAVATHPIAATYGGDARFVPATSVAFNVDVARASSAVALASSAALVNFASPLTLTATATTLAPGAGTPTGAMTFFDGPAKLGIVVMSGGVATLTLSTLSVGTHSLTASYGGDAGIAPSTSNALSQTIDKTASAIALATSPAAPVFGQAVVLSATVSGPGSTATGTVTFFDGAATLGTATLTAGVASLAVSTLATGSHSITAGYEGDVNFAASVSAAAAVAVGQAASSTTLTSSASTTAFGSPLTLTAAVSAVAPGAGLPSGTVTFFDNGTSLGSAALALGSASFTTSSPLALGAHSLTARYSGDSGFTSSTSAPVTDSVGKGAAAVAVAQAPASPVFGQAVTITATLSGAGSTPTGTVSFFDGTTNLGPATIAAGVATLSTSALSVGNHSLRASYGGDANFNSVTSPPSVVTIFKSPSVATLASSAPSSTFGAPLTLTATLGAGAPGSGTPTGTVSFLDNGVGLGTAALAGGVATLTVSSLAVGAHKLTAAYAGDGNFVNSSSASFGQVIVRSTPSISFSLTPPSIVYGQYFALTAVVSGTGAPATGSVAFYDGTTALGTASITAGVASLSVSSLGAGSHTLTATYGGDGSFTPVSSSGASATVAKAGSTVALVTSGLNATFGDTVTLTAAIGAVAPGSGFATGTVTFYDGTTVLGTGLVSGNLATFTTSALSIGSHNLTASYGGDANFGSSTSPAGSTIETIARPTASVVLAASPSTPVFGQPVALTAAVTGPGGTATGSVTFYDGSTSLGTRPISSGVATLVTTTLSAGGSHRVVASYGGDSNFNSATSASIEVAVGKSASAAALASSQTSVLYGSPVLLTATVSAVAPGSGTPSRLVVFYDGKINLGTTMLNESGIATLSLSTLRAGTHDLTVSYAGDGSFSGSVSPAGSLIETIAKATPLVSVAPSTAAPVFGQTIALTATVSGPGDAPTGTVQFFDGETSLGTATLSDGVAKLATAALSMGDHQIRASYGGDANFNSAGYGPASLPVGKASSVAALAVDLNPSLTGEPIKLTANVSAGAPGAGVPSGTVSFMDGAAVLGTGTLSGGLATFTTAGLSVDIHQLWVTYAGDAFFVGVASPGLAQTVAKATTTLAVTSSDATPVFGESVTFTATLSVNAPGAGTPTGTVTFKDGTAILGSASLDATGIVKLTSAALIPGSHSVNASYSGDAAFAASAGSVLEGVNRAATATVVAVAPVSSVLGQAVALTANVSVVGKGVGAPSGNVLFTDGATALGTAPLRGGTASLAFSSLGAGAHSIAATYKGDSSFAGSTSAAVAQTVSAAPTAVALASSPVNPVVGQPVTLTAKIAVAAPGIGTPVGSIAFTDGKVSLGSAPIQSGAASLILPSLAAGTHMLLATWTGTVGFAQGSGAQTLTVGQGATRTALVASTASGTLGQSAQLPIYGQPLTFTATVSVLAPAAGAPGGLVAFQEAGVTIGQQPLDESGRAVLTISSLGAGSRAVTAIYPGDASFSASASDSSSLAIAKATAAVALVPSQATSVTGERASFVLTASSSAGQPTGQVSLSDAADALGSAAVSSAGSVAVATSALHAGRHSLVASYAGDANFSTALGQPVAYTVAPAATSVAVTASARTPRVDRPVALRAVVAATAPGSGTPKGYVEFTDGATRLGTTGLDETGAASLSVVSLTHGSHPIVASYLGSSDYSNSSGALAGGEQIEQSPPVAGSGTAVSFDGKTQAALIANESGTLDTAKVVEVWFARADTDAPGAAACLLQQGEGRWLRLGLCLSAARDGLEVRRGSATASVKLALRAGWHHLALIDEETQTAVYFDGAQAATLAGGFAPSLPDGGRQPLVLAAAGAARDDRFAGMLDEVRLWSASRKGADVVAGRMEPVARKTEALLAVFRMDEGSGAILYDGATSGQTAALEGSPPFVASTAWKHRTTPQGRPLAFAGGYDPDASALTVTLVTPPQSGSVALAGSTLEYTPGAAFKGTDTLTYTVSNGLASNQFTTEVAIVQPTSCKVDADCDVGNVCVANVCQAAPVIHAAHGCGSVPADGTSPALLPLLALAFALLRRRSRARA